MSLASKGDEKIGNFKATGEIEAHSRMFYYSTVVQFIQHELTNVKITLLTKFFPDIEKIKKVIFISA